MYTSIRTLHVHTYTWVLLLPFICLGRERKSRTKRNSRSRRTASKIFFFFVRRSHNRFLGYPFIQGPPGHRGPTGITGSKGEKVDLIYMQKE